MNSRSTAFAIVCIGCGVAYLFSTPSLADEIRVSGGDCGRAVRLVARDAPLSNVLKRLAQTLDFQLSFESDSDPLINVNALRDPVELVALLAPSENISFTQARNPRCSNREQIVKVWVLPKGQKNLVRTVSAAPAAPDPNAEQARRAREGADLVLKSHGLPPQQPEEQNPDNPENPEIPENPH